MELKGYLRTVMAKRWIFLATFTITLGAILTLTSNQPPVYESVTTYLVIPNLPEQDARASASAVDILNDDQVERTVAQVAKSQVIKSKAASSLGLSGGQMAGVSVSSRVLPGTNVIEIAVQGHDPAVARDVASTIGPLTTSFLQGPNWIYSLVILDQPTMPSSSSQPKWFFNLLLGTIAALVMGAGMALLFSYLQLPSKDKLSAAEVGVGRADQSPARHQTPIEGTAAKVPAKASSRPSCTCSICTTSAAAIAAKAAATQSALQKSRKA